MKYDFFNINTVHYYLIGILILTFPYHISNGWVGTLAILSFLIVLYNRSFELVTLFKERTLFMLFLFIMFTYASVLWSSVPAFSEASEIETNLDRFKYYFFLVPSIYFSGFSKSRIKTLIMLLALSAVPLIILNYTNYFGITNYYSEHHGGNSTILGSRLKESIFILFTCIYLYVYLLSAFREKKLKQAFVFLVLFVISASSLWVDRITLARISLVALALVVIIGPYFFWMRKYVYVAPIVVVILTLLVFNNERFRKGFEEFETAIVRNEYIGSWGYRTAYTIVGFKIFLEHPLLGHGINDIEKKFQDMKIRYPEYFIHENNLNRLHNDHLYILAQTGLVGYILFLMFCYMFFRERISDIELNVFKNLFFLSFLVLMLGEHYLTLKFSTNLLAIVIGLVMAYKKIDTKGVVQNQNN